MTIAPHKHMSRPAAMRLLKWLYHLFGWNLSLLEQNIAGFPGFALKVCGGSG
jgi:hypothetical protein